MSDAPRRSRPRIVSGIAVVVPAHDEEHRLAACIDSVHRALDHRSVRGLPGVLVLVLDGCTDESRRVAEARTRDGDVIVEVAAHNVGAARAHGSAIALEELGRRGVPIGRAWLANTDADSTVPHWWLTRQVRLAAGADGIAGVVRVDDWSEHAPGTRRRFDAAYGGTASPATRPVLGADAHPHVHGANLGVRGDAYLAAGGFAPLPCHEDHGLWRSLRHDGRPLLATRRLWVTTSGRRTGRAAGGFADSLRRLAETTSSGTALRGG